MAEATLPPGERRTIDLEGGVRVEILTEGSGATIAPGDEVALHYTISYVPKPAPPPAPATDAAAPPAEPTTPASAAPAATGEAPVAAPTAEPPSAEPPSAETASEETAKPSESAPAMPDATEAAATEAASAPPAPAPPPAPLEPVVVATTRGFGAPVRVRAGREGPLLPALSRALVGLRAGTVARITLPPDQAYGAAGLAGAGIPGDVTLEAEVRVRAVMP